MQSKRSKNKFSQAWIHRHLNDPYVKLAQQRGYRARAAFKLLEIDEQDKLIKPGMTVVDLGSVPGSWSQVVREKLVGPNGALHGRIIALDLLPMEPIPDVTFLQGDFREEEMLHRLEAELNGEPVDLVLSDMAPNLSGIEISDAARMEHVIELALEFAGRQLKPEGAMLVKAFHGSGYSQLVKQFKSAFRQVAARKPKASRDESAETFILGRGFKAPGNRAGENE
jgi:23S rRNA (uridine2552-2'-O)-methyltransferase